MGNDHLVIEGEITSAHVKVQVRNYDFPSEELEKVTAWPEYTLTRSLGLVSYSPNTGCSRFVGFGEVFLVPAGDARSPA